MAAAPRSVFLTGASSGLGEALARHYAKEGATLGLVARRAGELERVARSLAPAVVVSYTADVRDAGAMLAAARDFVGRHGVPDVVIANAGVSRGTLVEHAEDLEAFRAVFDTNVAGIVHTFHPFVAPMRDARRGTLVGIASLAAPFLVMQPAMGYGIAASRTPKPAAARLRSLTTHAVFGLGLYGAGWATAGLNALFNRAS